MERRLEGGETEKKYYVLQFGDISFYEWLVSIGVGPCKSKVLKDVEINNLYFADFFRGCIDGDGSISISMHPESARIQVKLRLCSASKDFLDGVHSKVRNYWKIRGGWINQEKSAGVYSLNFGKADARKIIDFMYYSDKLPWLGRKYKMAMKCAGGEIGRHATLRK